MTKYRVDFARAAEREIDAIEKWIAAESPEAADRWSAGLLEAVDRLEEMPLRCPIAPESGIRVREIRQLIHGRYRILFTVVPNRVVILHVRHGARLPLRAE